MTLYAYYPLTDDSGDALDYSGNEYHGTVNGATQGVTGILGNTAYDFDDANSEIVSVSNFPYGFFNSDGWSFSAWVNADTTDDGMVLRQRPHGDSNYSLQINNDGNWRIQEPNGGIDSNAVTTNTWVHLAAVYVKDGEYIFYINGTENGRDTLSTNFDNTATLGIGGDAINNTNYFDGQIAEVRYYDHALTPAEVLYLYHVATAPSQLETATKVS